MLGASVGLQAAQSPKAGWLKNRMSLVDDGYQHRCNEIGLIKPLQSDVVYSCISAAVLTGTTQLTKQPAVRCQQDFDTSSVQPKRRKSCK